MSVKIEEAILIIKSLGFPEAQQNERSALCLLALLDLREDQDWNKSQNPLIGITPMMTYSAEHYGKEYAPNTRETFRRQSIHQFVDGALALYNPDKPDRPVNSPKAVYQIAPEALEVICSFNTKQWEPNLKTYLSNKKTLVQQYAKLRGMEKTAVSLDDGIAFELSPGSHSNLIAQIVEEFAPRFTPKAKLLYAGDTGGDKVGYYDEQGFLDLEIILDKHGKLPDVVLYYEEKGWLVLVEAVTSHGPVDGKRHEELAKLFKDSPAGLVYVTAFPSRKDMRKYLAVISWETEVWIAENPDHLIHFNGERFLGPYGKG